MYVLHVVRRLGDAVRGDTGVVHVPDERVVAGEVAKHYRVHVVHCERAERGKEGKKFVSRSADFCELPCESSLAIFLGSLTKLVECTEMPVCL